MRPLAAASLLAALVAAALAGCTGTTVPPPTTDPAPVRPAYAFGAPVAPEERPHGFGSEPSLLSTPDGTLYFSSVLGSAPPPEDPMQAADKRGDAVWRSDDGGATWTYLGKADYPFGGGDSDLDVLPSGRLLLTGQWRPTRAPDNPLGVYPYVTGGESVSYSDDRGATWTPSPAAGYLPAADRNWLATAPALPDLAYLVFNDAATGLMVGKTTDGGVTWLPPAVVEGTGEAGGVAGGPNGIAGDPVLGNDGQLFIPYGVSIGGGAAQRVYRSSDGGQTFTELTVHETPSGETAGGIFAAIAIDREAGLHYAWAETRGKGLRVFYSQSTDDGGSWTPAQMVSPPDVTAAFPWIAAGAQGHVAVGYYATAGSALPDAADANATWLPTVAFGTAGADGTVAFTAVAVTDRPNHRGPICTQGTGCSGGRDLGDFFEIALLPDGRVAVVYADDAGDERLNLVAVQGEGPGLCPSLPADESCNVQPS